MKTYSPKLSDIDRKWHVLDASKAPLGRVSTAAAKLLTGKGKPGFSAHMDMGDFVIIINSDNLVSTGNKMSDKEYYRHSGFPGGIYKRTQGEQLQRDSKKVIFHAVRGMLPVNKLRKERLDRLKIYTGAEHTHAAQNPLEYDMKESK